MKKTLTAVYGLLFLAASAAVAQQYQAPDIKLGKHPVNDTGVKQENWSSDYQVRERADAERQLASDDDADYRGERPSYETTGDSSRYNNPAVKPWHFEKDRKFQD